MTRDWWIVVALTTLSLVLGVLIDQSIPRAAFTIAEDSQSLDSHLEKLLTEVTSGGRVQKGAKVSLAIVRTDSGETVEISVVEGTFEDRTIEPEEVWQKVIGYKALLVNSADEYFRNDGGVSEHIGKGCTLNRVDQKATGDLIFTQCVGNYRDRFPGIIGVESAIIQAWSSVDEEKDCEPAAVSAVEGPQNYHNKCVTDAIERAMSTLLESLNPGEIDTIILPALGTGTARLPKSMFYLTAFKAIEKCLAAKNNCAMRLPKHFVLSVWSGEGPDKWTETKSAIERTFSNFLKRWNIEYSPDSNFDKQARYLGISLALLVFMFLIASKNRLAMIVFPGGVSSILLLGWGFAAAGALSVVSGTLAELVPHSVVIVFSPVFYNIILGSISVLSCLVVKRAADAFR